MTHPASAQYLQQGVNTLVPPLDNKKVRQALNYALDRKRFAETACSAPVSPMRCRGCPSSPAYDAEKHNAIAFDLDKAEVAAGRGRRADLDVRVSCRSATYPELTQMAQIYQNDLAKIGVKLTIKNLESAAFYDSVNGRKYQGLYSTPIPTPRWSR